MTLQRDLFGRVTIIHQLENVAQDKTEFVKNFAFLGFINLMII